MKGGYLTVAYSDFAETHISTLGSEIFHSIQSQFAKVS